MPARRSRRSRHSPRARSRARNLPGKARREFIVTLCRLACSKKMPQVATACDQSLIFISTAKGYEPLKMPGEISTSAERRGSRLRFSAPPSAIKPPVRWPTRYAIRFMRLEEANWCRWGSNERRNGRPAGWTKGRPLRSGVKPDGRPLFGRYVTLEHVSAEKHGAALYRSFADADPEGTLWTYMGYGPFDSSEAISKLAAGKGEKPRSAVLRLRSEEDRQGLGHRKLHAPGCAERGDRDRPHMDVA